MDFEVVGEAEAAQPAARGTFRPARGKAVAAGGRQAVALVVEEAPAVDDEAGDGGERRFLRVRQVARAQRRRVQPQLRRRPVDEPFQRIGRLGAAGAAIGVHRHRVGEDAFHPDVDGLETIGPRLHRRAHAGRGEWRILRQARAQVGGDAHADGEEAPLRIERDLRLRPVVARLDVGKEGLAPGGGPAHRPAGLAGRVDAADPGVSIRRAQDEAVDRVVEANVVHATADAAQEGRFVPGVRGDVLMAEGHVTPPGIGSGEDRLDGKAPIFPAIRISAAAPGPHRQNRG